jgi:hypothetical protein
MMEGLMATRISKILTQDWPSDHPPRIKALQEAAGRLPFHERYAAGEFRNVWTELNGLGDAVWFDPIAADALAVAYETMHRAKTNVETLVSRLAAVEYDGSSCSLAGSSNALACRGKPRQLGSGAWESFGPSCRRPLVRYIDKESREIGG